MRVTNFFEMYMETSKVEKAPAGVPTTEKETFTRAEVEQMINAKIEEVLKTITPTNVSDTPTVDNE